MSHEDGEEEEDQAVEEPKQRRQSRPQMRGHHIPYECHVDGITESHREAVDGSTYGEVPVVRGKRCG